MTEQIELHSDEEMTPEEVEAAVDALEQEEFDALAREGAAFIMHFFHDFSASEQEYMTIRDSASIGETMEGVPHLEDPSRSIEADYTRLHRENVLSPDKRIKRQTHYQRVRMNIAYWVYGMKEE
ncbi:hypothetical protein C5B42_01490 [Candidatus Cerribacteria bacterium 'Amazon FNV 2010 28 9']|uniref:Uncharacterized protein n=1 Tax=Candidatus Cerribacteria bacterium 'Amazon FNV 2010 28 9' TaxID=2081795 RepID=A0A317JPD2_9BACT|nr:MAG: hypothetical protein C5B42_01490 [Candidatus Cerribacteria bacterium 'Amazon FNV 2010 28 9']